jgi:hypothetical protein
MQFSDCMEYQGKMMRPVSKKFFLKWSGTVLLALMSVSVALASDWTYRIRLNDNIWDLSSRYLKPDVPWQKLQDYNKVTNPYHLPPGMMLHVPIAWLRVQPARAQVVAVIGSAHVQLPGHTQPVVIASGMMLDYGSRLSTDANASLTLQFADGSRVLMQQDSQLELDQMSAYGRTGMVDTRLRLQHGRVSSAVTPMTGVAAHFSVETPSTISSVRGTHFRVTADASESQTEVLTGRVDVAGDHAHVLVHKGLGVASTDGSQPSRPQPLLPAPALHCPTLPVSQLPYAFGWTALDGARQYRVQMAPDERFEVLLLDQVTDSPQASLPDVPDGDYAVRARGIDGDHLEGQDSVCTLHISGHPQPPLVMEPLPDSKVRDTRPDFRWTQNLQATSYVWQLAGDAEFKQPIASESKLTGDDVRAPQALPYGRYYWRIASRDPNGKLGPFSHSMAFDLVTQPHAPAIGKPKSSGHGINFGWQAGISGQRYHIQMDRDPGFPHPQVDQTVEQPMLQIQKPHSGTWYLRVQTIDTDGYAGPWGDVQKIHVACVACRIAVIGGGGALLWILL